MNKEYRLTIYAYERYFGKSDYTEMFRFSASEYFEEEEKMNKLLHRLSDFYEIFEVSYQQHVVGSDYSFVEGDELL